MNYSKTIRNYEELLRLEGKSINTIKIYSSLVVNFLIWSKKDIYHISGEMTNKYLRLKIIDDKLSDSWQNQFINAISKFFKLTLNKAINPKWIKRPSKKKKLIEILTVKESWELINSITNIKQKAIISGIYLHGLRRSEILKVKYEHIDRKRNLILIKNSKGGKDRFVPLCERWLDFLTEYARDQDHKKGYDKYIFHPYSESSIYSIVKTKAKQCGFKKRVYPHLLRDCYASHLLEQGIDTRFIQEILGHEKLETTQKYLHISAVNISKIALKLIS